MLSLINISQEGFQHNKHHFWSTGHDCIVCCAPCSKQSVRVKLDMEPNFEFHIWVIAYYIPLVWVVVFISINFFTATACTTQFPWVPAETPNGPNAKKDSVADTCWGFVIWGTLGFSRNSPKENGKHVEACWFVRNYVDRINLWIYMDPDSNEEIRVHGDLTIFYEQWENMVIDNGSSFG